MITEAQIEKAKSIRDRIPDKKSEWAFKVAKMIQDRENQLSYKKGCLLPKKQHKYHLVYLKSNKTVDYVSCDNLDGEIETFDDLEQFIDSFYNAYLKVPLKKRKEDRPEQFVHKVLLDFGLPDIYSVLALLEEKKLNYKVSVKGGDVIYKISVAKNKKQVQFTCASSALGGDYNSIVEMAEAYTEVCSLIKKFDTECIIKDTIASTALMCATQCMDDGVIVPSTSTDTLFDSLENGTINAVLNDRELSVEDYCSSVRDILGFCLKSGFVYIKDREMHKNIVEADVHSAYPYFFSHKLPIGDPYPVDDLCLYDINHIIVRAQIDTFQVIRCRLNGDSLKPGFKHFVYETTKGESSCLLRGSFDTTTTNIELSVAIAAGYKIEKVYSIYQFNMYSDFLSPFLKRVLELESALIDAHYENEGDLTKNSSGLNSISYSFLKKIRNSVYGKLASRGIVTKVLTEADVNSRPLSRTKFFVEDTQSKSFRTSVASAAYINSYHRAFMALSAAIVDEPKINRPLQYSDTDSFFIQDDSDKGCSLTTGMLLTFLSYGVHLKPDFLISEQVPVACMMTEKHAMKIEEEIKKQKSKG